MFKVHFSPNGAQFFVIQGYSSQRQMANAQSCLAGRQL